MNKTLNRENFKNQGNVRKFLINSDILAVLNRLKITIVTLKELKMCFFL